MNIALIAHDAKKELMVQFCIAYYGILCRHNLCATATTGRLVSEATSLNVVKFLSGTHGGTQQIASRVGFNEIDLLLFFRDPLFHHDRDSEMAEADRFGYATFTAFPLPPTLPPPRCSFGA